MLLPRGGCPGASRKRRLKWCNQGPAAPSFFSKKGWPAGSLFQQFDVFVLLSNRIEVSWKDPRKTYGKQQQKGRSNLECDFWDFCTQEKDGQEGTDAKRTQESRHISSFCPAWTNKQTHQQTSKQANKQTNKPNKHTNAQMHKQRAHLVRSGWLGGGAD